MAGKAQKVTSSVVRLDSLTGLRFFAAFVVYGLHVQYGGMRYIFGQGSIGVSFFFILSGTVLAWSWRPTDRARDFYRRRVARIYPVYVVAFLLGIVVTRAVGEGYHGLGAGLLGIFLLQAWVPDVHTYFALNGVSWSLSVEAFFYLLFPLLVTRVIEHWLDPSTPLRGIAAYATTLPVAVVIAWFLHIWVDDRRTDVSAGRARSEVVVDGVPQFA